MTFMSNLESEEHLKRKKTRYQIQNNQILVLNLKTT